MVIDINQAKIALADKYSIYIGEQLQYKAARKLFRLLPEVDLFYTGDPSPQLTLKKRISFFSASYVIRQQGSVFPFTTLSRLKHHYQCRAGSDLYDIYGQRGRKFSIYKNDRQIGWWDKEAVSWFAGDNYRILCDDDADHELLIAFCLIIDNYRSDDHDDQAVNIDLGNLGFQAKKFDSGWQPRSGK